MNGKKIACGSAILAVALGLMAVMVVMAAGLVYYFVGYRTALPEERPIDFSIEVSEGGGMLDMSANYSIYAGKGFYDSNYGAADVTAEYIPTDAELDALWSVLRAVRFDKISATEEDVYDRGGVTIAVDYGNEHVTVSDAGTSFLNDGGAKRFNRVANALYDLAEYYLEPQKYPITFALEPELADSLLYLYLNNDVMYIAPTSGSTAVNNLHDGLTLLPGDYQLDITTNLEFADPKADVVTNYVTQTLNVTGATTVTIGGTTANPTIAFSK